LQCFQRSHWTLAFWANDAKPLLHISLTKAQERSDLPIPCFKIHSKCLITSLRGALGESGSIVVYNQQFESQRLTELPAWLPEFRGWMKKIQRRLWDLLSVIRTFIYHPAFSGYSLKSVLPALVPQMSYDGLTVANGQDAGLAWESLIGGTEDPDERETIKNALQEYCALRIEGAERSNRH
jgi:hypothetical protein